MKPRVLFSANSYCARYRMVRVYSDTFQIEKADGRDAMNRTRWVRVCGDELRASTEEVLRSLGRSLVRREKAMRKARRGRK